jgi:hypothetical protein
VGAIAVVLLAPVFDDGTGVIERDEVVFVEAFIA